MSKKGLKTTTKITVILNTIAFEFMLIILTIVSLLFGFFGIIFAICFLGCAIVLPFKAYSMFAHSVFMICPYCNREIQVNEKEDIAVCAYCSNKSVIDNKESKLLKI